MKGVRKKNSNFTNSQTKRYPVKTAPSDFLTQHNADYVIYILYTSFFIESFISIGIIL